jgi:hypothetical protein
MWIFEYLAEIGVETKFGQKQPVRTWRLFSKFRQKITDFDIWNGFGGGLEHPNIWIFERLNRDELALISSTIISPDSS